MGSEDDRTLVGATLAHYSIEAKLGQGGMGVVYRARDSRLARDVALKVLPASVAADSERRARLLREARSAAAVNHSNIAAVYDVGESEGRVYLAMELVEGATLRERLARGALPAPEATRIARAIAAGLARAHERGIVHRDLKPENVMLGREGAVKILDFGLAKLHEPDSTDSALERQETQTLEGRVMGTPGYMSPEQASGRAVDARTDVYALGVVLQEMLTGGLPGRDAITDPRLAAIVAKCTAVYAADRWPDARHVLDALEGWREGASAPATKARKWALGAAGVLLVGAAAAVASRAVLAPRAGSAMASGSAPVASASASPAITPITDLPLPASAVPEAITEYRAGLQLVRDSDWLNAKSHFVRAGQLDPAMAAAHLRVAVYERLSYEKSRAALASASALRVQLSERDRTLLDAMEPLVGRSRPDSAENVRRMEAAVEKYPTDLELLDLLANEAARDPERALAVARRAAALDPQDLNAWGIIGYQSSRAGRVDEARAAYARCLSVSSGSSMCLLLQTELEGFDGRCATMEEDAQHLADFMAGVGSSRLLVAMRALDRPDAAVQALLEHWLAASPDGARMFRARQQAIDHIRAGRFDRAARALDEAVAAAPADSEGSSMWRVQTLLLRMRTDLAREMGEATRARREAQELLDRSAAIPMSRQEGGYEGWPWWIVAVAGRPLDPARAEWAEGELRDGVRSPELWLRAFAEPARTADEARAALDALARDPRLVGPTPTEVENWVNYPDRVAGHVLLLAGRASEALPYLRHAAGNCWVRGGDVPSVEVPLELGQALEQTNDAQGACGAYADVLSRWGHAVPRSVSADAARDGLKRLHCNP